MADGTPQGRKSLESPIPIPVPQAKQVREWVGLRPGRKSVRLEKETIPLASGRLRVVHNYGHGGAGLTLAWGCAGHAVRLASEMLEEGSARSRL